MGVMGALLATEVDFAVAATAAIFGWTVLGLKALDRCPGFQKGPSTVKCSSESRPAFFSLLLNGLEELGGPPPNRSADPDSGRKWSGPIPAHPELYR